MNKTEYINLLKTRLASARKEVEIFEELLGNLDSSDRQEFDESDVPQQNKRSSSRRQESSRQESSSRQEETEHLTKEGEPDKRFKENETEALRSARHRKGDGRGEVRDEENDLRLKENEDKRNQEGRRASQK